MLRCGKMSKDGNRRERMEEDVGKKIGSKSVFLNAIFYWGKEGFKGV
jgi:hypothetical protein